MAYFGAGISCFADMRPGVASLCCSFLRLRLTGDAGQVTEALGLLEVMRSDGTRPNEVTYNALISACERSYQVRKLLGAGMIGPATTGGFFGKFTAPAKAPAAITRVSTSSE